MRDIYLITKNELLVTIRNPFWIFYGLFQPIIYLVLFAPLLNGVAAMRGLPGGGAIQFFAPGLLIMNALFSAGFEGFALQDRVDFGGLHIDPRGAAALACLIVLIDITMASISYCLALITREGGALAGVTNTFILPLLILSGVMLPISFGPPIIQTLAKFDPFYYAVSAARALIQGTLGAPSIPLAFAVFLGLSVVTLTLFIRAMREAVA